MIRKEKEITHRAEIDAVIARCQVCHLAFCRDTTPCDLSGKRSPAGASF